MLTYTEERKLFYRECVAIVVLELLNSFGDDDNILDTWLVLPTDTDREGVKAEMKCFRDIMSLIELDCSEQRSALP